MRAWLGFCRYLRKEESNKNFVILILEVFGSVLRLMVTATMGQQLWGGEMASVMKSHIDIHSYI